MNYIVHPGIIQADFYKFCNKAYTKNGRMYDPALGRFLSPDLFMQDPSNTQNFNRYSYCLNNPLKFIDPSGFVYSGATPKSYYHSPAYPVIYGNYGGASLNTRSKKSGIYIDGEFIPCNNFFVSMVGGAENIENVQQDGHIAWDSQNFNYEIGGRLTGNFYERGLWTQVASNWTNQYRIGMVGSKNFVCGMAGEVIWTFTSYKDLNYTFNEFFKKNYPIDDPYMTSDYGPGFLNGRPRNHHGLDLVNKKGNSYGKPIYAIKGGVISKVVKYEDGNFAGIRMSIKSDNGYIYNYFHLMEGSNYFFEKGEYVKDYECIGRIGSTGRSTGPHLHFEIMDYFGNKSNPYNIYPIFYNIPK